MRITGSLSFWLTLYDRRLIFHQQSMVNVSAESLPLHRPIVRQYVDWHSADTVADLSVDMSTDISQSIYRPTLNRYVSQHIYWHLPIYRPRYVGRHIGWYIGQLSPGTRRIMCTNDTRDQVSIDSSDRHLDRPATCRSPLGWHVNRYMIDTRPTTGDSRSSVDQHMCWAIVSICVGR